MITAETVVLEKTIRRATYKMGTFGCSIKDGTLDIQHLFTKRSVFQILEK